MAKKVTTKKATTNNRATGSGIVTSARKPAKAPATSPTKKKPSRFVAAKLKIHPEAAKGWSSKASPATMPKRRSDLNAPGEVAINRLPAPKRAVAKLVHALLFKLVPGANSIVKWGNACYYHDGVCFAVLYETKACINLGLPGATISDPHKLLHGTGKKMRHIKLATKADAGHPGIPPIIRAAHKIGFEGM